MPFYIHDGSPKGFVLYLQKQQLYHCGAQCECYGPSYFIACCSPSLSYLYIKMFILLLFIFGITVKHIWGMLHLTSMALICLSFHPSVSLLLCCRGSWAGPAHISILPPWPHRGWPACSFPAQATEPCLQNSTLPCWPRGLLHPPWLDWLPSATFPISWTKHHCKHLTPPLPARALNCSGRAVLVWQETWWALAQTEDSGRFQSVCTQQSGGH